MTIPWTRLCSTFALAFALAASSGRAAPAAAAADQQQALTIGTAAYIYGYPLVLMDITKQVMTATPAPTAKKAPINQFANYPRFPGPADTDVVSPNVDTLYSWAWLDLSREPIVMTVPAMHDRFYVLPVLDAFTNVIASPGTRTTGQGPGAYAIVGPGWNGKLPAGVEKIQSPTNMAWIIGRILCRGPSDYAAVNALQAQLTLTPLSAWGTDYTPPSPVAVEPGVDAATPPVEQIAKLDGPAFFGRLAALLRTNPPAAADADLIRQLALIGIVPGQDFSFSALAAPVQQGLTAAVQTGAAAIAAATSKLYSQTVDGWSLLYGFGSYGPDYLLRALVAQGGLGANLTADAFYPVTRADADGEPLSGANRYVLHFDAGDLPPVDGFWSLTLYDERQFLAANSIGRYALGDRSRLSYGKDGSLDLYVQTEPPAAELRDNWLPAPAGSFNLALRLYAPKAPALSGRWTPPAVQRVGPAFQ